MKTYPDIRSLIEQRTSGPRSEKSDYIRRCQCMRFLILGRWPAIRKCHQWQVKHLRWCLEHALRDHSPEERYRYYLAVCAFGHALGRWPDWERFLRGPWQSPL